MRHSLAEIKVLLEWTSGAVLPCGDRKSDPITGSNKEHRAKQVTWARRNMFLLMRTICDVVNVVLEDVGSKHAFSYSIIN